MLRHRIHAWRSRLMLPAAALAVLGCLVAADPQPRSAIGLQDSVVWVYQTALCARAGDASDCTPVARAERPHFASHDACAQFRDEDLAREANPRLLGLCLRLQEA